MTSWLPKKPQEAPNIYKSYASISTYLSKKGNTDEELVRIGMSNADLESERV